ncbi:MAG: hypothetical protein WBP29_07745 [Candidatus Zixiibacteriota bacterium]
MTLFAPAAIFEGSEFGISLYSFSYHIDGRDVTGYRFNERNPGVGAHFVLSQGKRSQYYVEAAMHEDSYKRTAKYATLMISY